jgi:GTP-binding protein EngB required for normal cell division
MGSRLNSILKSFNRTLNKLDKLSKDNRAAAAATRENIQQLEKEERGLITEASQAEQVRDNLAQLLTASSDNE